MIFFDKNGVLFINMWVERELKTCNGSQ